MTRVCVIEGDDAAPEAVRPTVALVDRLGLGIEWLRPRVDDDGSAAREAIDAAAATLFGATSGRSVRALFHLRWGKRTYANVRPCRWLPGARSPLAAPEGVDLVVVRENLEDLYVGVEGDLAALPSELKGRMMRGAAGDLGPGRFALKVITEAGSERVARFAFELARRRAAARGRPAKVTCGTKHNMLPGTDGLFREVAARVARGYADVAFESFLADDLARRLVAVPHELDVVVLPNLYGDVLSDEAAGVIGGLGLAPSGCYGDDYAYFEPAHGTAPDLAGTETINPTATILSAAMMLEYLGAGDAARRLEAAVARVYAEGRRLTPDQGGTARTGELADAVAAFL